MSHSQLLIPPRIRVGFNKRDDTYTGRLGYVIYYDTKGKLCRETSWEWWREKDIEPVEFDNVPTEGFVINKNGGGRGGHSWNDRQAFVRVYDPRNFEFEIAVDNLVFILCQGGCTPGKGLEGKFVYGWRGGRLVLMPCHSEEYKSSVEFTELRDKSVHLKNLVEGATYITKSQDLLVYLGRHKPLILDPGYRQNGRYEKLKGQPPYVFYRVNAPANAHPWVFMPDGRDLAECRDHEPAENLADLKRQILGGPAFSSVVAIEAVDTGVPVQRDTVPKSYPYKWNLTFAEPRPDGGIWLYTLYRGHLATANILDTVSKVSLVDGVVQVKEIANAGSWLGYGFGGSPEQRDAYERAHRAALASRALHAHITTDQKFDAIYAKYGTYRARVTLASGDHYYVNGTGTITADGLVSEPFRLPEE